MWLDLVGRQVTEDFNLRVTEFVRARVYSKQRRKAGTGLFN
jgi:hypothetical protein